MKKIEFKKSSLGERYIEEVNGSLFEIHSAKAVFDRYLPKETSKEHMLTFMVGCDSGLLLRYLNDLAKSVHSFFICFDFPEIVEAIRADGWSDTEHVRLVETTVTIDTFAQEESLSSYFLREAIQILPSMAVFDKHPEYLSLWESMKGQFSASTIAHNTSQAAMFIERHLTNMTELLFPISRFENQLVGKTAVLLGGGPSVSILFDWVRLHRDNLIVFAANRLSDRLVNENITPDFFVAVDPQPALLDYCKSMFQFAEKSILLCSSAVSSNVLLQWAGKIIYSDEPTPFNDYVLVDGAHGNLKTTGPTVMNFALQSAWFMGCNDIVMAGIDLCYSSEGQSHESNSIESKAGKFLKVGGATVRTFNNDMANTDPQMLLALQVMTKQLDYYHKVRDNLRVFQVNSNAAYMDNVELCSVEQLPIPKNDVNLMNAIHKSANWHASVALTWLEELEHQVDKRLKLYRSLNKPISTALAQVRRLKKMSPQALVRTSKLIARVKHRFESCMGEERFLLFDFAFVDYVKVLTPLNAEGEQQGIDEIQTIFSEFFFAAYKSLLKFSARLEEVKLRITLRKAEALGELTPQMLSQWLLLEEPGRALVWRKRNAHLILSSDQEELLMQAEHAFNDLLQHNAPSFKSQFMSRETRMSSLWEQVEAAIYTNDSQRLSAISQYLLEQDEDDEFQQLGVYSQMGLAFLRQEWADVVEFAKAIHLERLMIPKSKLLVSAYLSMSDLSNALREVEFLCRYNNNYFVIYAEIATILGLLDLAEFAFRLAVQTHTDDELTLEKALNWARKHHRNVFLMEYGFPN